MKQQKFAEACAAFEGSYKLDPDISTLLNHANCRAKNAQLATAWRLFTDAQRQTNDQPDATSMQLNAVAMTRAGELEARLSKLSVDVAQDYRLDGLEVLREADRLDPAAWSRLLPVDGGTYKITARAPGHATWSATVVVKPEGDIQIIAIPKLDPLTAAKPKPDERPPAPADTPPTHVPPTDAKPTGAPPIDVTPARTPPTDVKPTPAPPMRVTSTRASPIDAKSISAPPDSEKPEAPLERRPAPARALYGAPPSSEKPEAPLERRPAPARALYGAPLDSEEPEGPRSPGEPASETRALMLSLGGTLASYGFMIAAGSSSSGGEDNTAIVLSAIGGLGIVLAPSFGHWYAGKYFPRGMWMRLASPLVVTAGIALAVASDSSSGGTIGGLAAVTGFGLFVYGTIDDIATARSRVRQRNRGRGFAIAPVATSSSAGFTLGGQF